MDPISVEATIMGLLAAAAKASSILDSVITSAQTAPKLAQNALVEVTDISLCLNQLQSFLERGRTGIELQAYLVPEKLVVVVLCDCVSVFTELGKTLDLLKIEEPWQASELEQSLDLLNLEEPRQAHRAVKWMRGEKDVAASLTRLRSSKASLSLLMTALNWQVITR